ncbi:MAG: galactokinase [Chloroherpetonaceae bacterium]
MITRHAMVEAFRARYGTVPKFVSRAPGRVNLIGEHTDYNDGFVMPFALPHSTWIAFSPRTDDIVELHSLDFHQTASFSLSSFEKSKGWIDYVKGVARALQTHGQALKGFEGVIHSDVPIGAGLSSSAAIEVASLLSFLTVSNLQLTWLEQVSLAQQAEREWIGMNCGVMDQMTCVKGELGKAIFLDCRTMDFRYVPLPEGAVIVVMDTSTRRKLTDSRYNMRRAECEAAAHYFNKSSLRDVSLEELSQTTLPDLLKRRARHVVSENLRVLKIATTETVDPHLVGTLLNESHQSLRNDFEVSSLALDTIVEIAQHTAGCYGARMTGAGFAGCAIALVSREAAESFIQSVEARYRALMPFAPLFFIAQASSGATVEATTSCE